MQALALALAYWLFWFVPLGIVARRVVFGVGLVALVAPLASCARLERSLYMCDEAGIRWRNLADDTWRRCQALRAGSQLPVYRPTEGGWGQAPSEGNARGQQSLASGSHPSRAQGWPSTNGHSRLKTPGPSQGQAGADSADPLPHPPHIAVADPGQQSRRKTQFSGESVALAPVQWGSHHVHG